TPQQPIDQDDLAEADRKDSCPSQCFSPAQAMLSGFRQPELQLEGSKLKHVPVSQLSVFDELTIETDEGFGRGLEQESLHRIKVDREMFVPNALFFKLQVSGGRSTDSYRKTAGNPNGARLCA